MAQSDDANSTKYDNYSSSSQASKIVKSVIKTRNGHTDCIHWDDLIENLF